MQRIFELISSVNNFVNTMKATVKKVCRNIIITMATAITVLTVIIVSVIINGEKNVVAQTTNYTDEENVHVVENDVEDDVTEIETEAETTVVVENETTTEAETNQVVENETEEQTSVYLSDAQVEVKDIVTSTYAPVEIYYTEKDYDALIRIVHAEAGNQDDIGKILVANVIINRVKSERFPNDIYSVVTQNNGKTYQFSPVRPGKSFYTVTPTEHTIECVNRALAGEDYSKGALFFCCKTSPDSWFNKKLTFLFTHGPHYFYK